MANVILLPKDDQNLPHYYGVKIEYVTGKTREYRAASHSFNQNILEIKTFEDEIKLEIIQNILEISFDKDFNKVIELMVKNEANNNKK